MAEQTSECEQTKRLVKGYGHHGKGHECTGCELMILALRVSRLESPTRPLAPPANDVTMRTALEQAAYDEGFIAGQQDMRSDGVRMLNSDTTPEYRSGYHAGRQHEYATNPLVRARRGVVAPPADAEQQETEVKASEDVAAELRIAADGIEFRWFNDPRANPPPAMIAHLRALADRLAPPAKANGVDGFPASYVAHPAADARKVQEAIAAKLVAPPARVRMCPRCDKHPAGESDLCDACRPGVMGNGGTATAEPPLADRLAATMTRDKRLDLAARLGEPIVPSAPAAEPLTAEDGLRERAEEWAAQILDWNDHTKSAWLHFYCGDEVNHGGQVLTGRDNTIFSRTYLADILLAFARAAPTARATISDANGEPDAARNRVELRKRARELVERRYNYFSRETQHDLIRHFFLFARLNPAAGVNMPTESDVRTIADQWDREGPIGSPAMCYANFGGRVLDRVRELNPDLTFADTENPPATAGGSKGA